MEKRGRGRRNGEGCRMRRRRSGREMSRGKGGVGGRVVEEKEHEEDWKGEGWKKRMKKG